MKSEYHPCFLFSPQALIQFFSKSFQFYFQRSLNLSLYALPCPSHFLQHAFCLTSSSSQLSLPFHSSPPIIHCLHTQQQRDPSVKYIRPYHSPTNNPNSHLVLNLKALPCFASHSSPLYPNLEITYKSASSLFHFLCLHSSFSRSFHGFASSCQSGQLKSFHS